MTRLTFTLSRGDWLTANGRYHWAVRAKVTRRLRQYARLEAARFKPLATPVRAIATIRYKTKGRADPHNAAPTVKALIDGAVDAGLIPDDDSTHLVSLDFRRGEPHGKAGVHIIYIDFEEVSDEDS